jgi:catechol 2,3-dioxygenase-like lactoylglutathione lyase family enzyme
MPNLYTADAERAVAFYRDLLGGTQTFRYPGVPTAGDDTFAWC